MSPHKFDHLVVVMMENRSFDHMLGMLYSNDDPPPNQQTFDGVADVDGKPRTNPGPGGPIAVAPVTSFYGVKGDPHHDYSNVQWQLFFQRGQTIPPQPPPPMPLPPIPSPVASMQGFVEDYAPNEKIAAAEIMSYFPTYDPANPGQAGLRILPALARNFAVCDRWFASVPTQTLPNRSFCNAGTSNGFVENDDDWINLNTNKTIFTALANADTGGIAPWRIYHDTPDPEFGQSLTFHIHWPELSLFDDPALGYRATIAQFETDAAFGTLPAYSFIEPNIMGYEQGLPLNDQHPEWDIRDGENFINRIYSAIANSEKVRDNTLLVITYDEHGGIYDHVSPPYNVPAPPPPQPLPVLPPGMHLLSPPRPDPPRFDFTRLGVRVPAVIVSSYIPAGTVYHPSSGWVDHTAIIKTLATRWNLEPLGPRDAAAPDLGELLTLDQPRTILPITPPPWENIQSDLRPADEVPANDLQRDFVQLIARAHGLPPPPPPRTAADVTAFLRSVPREKHT